MKNLKRKQQRLIKSLPPFSRIIRGTFARYYLTCGKKQCRCHSGRKHGPYYYLGITDKGKTRMLLIPSGKEEVTALGVKLYRKLWGLLTQLSEVNRQLLWQEKGNQDKD